MRRLTTTFLFIALTCNSFSQFNKSALKELSSENTKQELDSIVCFKFISEDDSIRYSKNKFWQIIQSDNKLDDRVYSYRWKDDWWYPSSCVKTITNDKGLITEKVYSVGHSTSWWEASDNYVYSYDLQNRMTSMKHYVRDAGSPWSKKSREDYIYIETDDGYEHKTISYVGNTKNDEWMESDQTIIAKNRDSVLDYRYYLKWNKTKALWDTTSLLIYDFPYEHEQVETRMKRDVSGTSWVPYERTHDYFNNKHKSEKSLLYVWDHDLKEWERTVKTVIKYFGDDIATISDSLWNVESSVPVLEYVELYEATFIKEGVSDSVKLYAWDTDKKELYMHTTYVKEWDDNDNMTKKTHFRFNNTTANWDTISMEIHAYNEEKQPILGTRYLFTDNIRRGKSGKKYDYNENGDLNFYDEYTWDEATWEWNLFKRNFYYYKEPVVTLNTYISEPLIKIYPNPAQDYLHITNLVGQSKITVTTLHGSEILNAMVTKNSFTLNLTGHASGMYIVHIENSCSVFTEKVLKK